MKNKNIWSLILSAAARSVEYKSIFYNIDGELIVYIEVKGGPVV